MGDNPQLAFPLEWTPLLTKPFATYSPEDFKTYVKGLKQMPPQKTIKIKAAKPPYVVKVSAKKKQFSLKITREPKWLSEEELKEITRTTGWKLNELFIYMKKKEIIVSSREEQDEITRAVAEIPF